MTIELDEVIKHLDHDAWWEGAPEWADLTLREYGAEIDRDIAEINADIKGSRGGARRMAEERRSEMVVTKTAVIDRIRWLNARRPKPHRWSGSLQEAVDDIQDAAKWLGQRVDELERAIQEHRDGTIRDEIEPGPYDLALWHIIEPST